MGEEDFTGMLLLLRLVAFTPTWNMTGQPAIALPAGLDDDGLPVSVQLVGRAADESTSASGSPPSSSRRARERTRRPPVV